MTKQRFFNTTFIFLDQKHKWGRGVQELFLQHFFSLHELKGIELSEKIGTKKLFIKTIDNQTGDKWWTKNFAITQIKQGDKFH